MNSSEIRSTVFVGNVAVFCSEAELHQHFSVCGEIVEIRLAKSEDQAKHLSYGFVRYSNIGFAQLAMRTLNGSLLCGRPLKVDKAQSRSDRTTFKVVDKKSQSGFNSASVHVTFISHQIRKIINEETLRFLFSRFGEISDVIITKHNIDEAAQKQSGYGFVHFPLTQDGINSAMQMSDVVCDLMIDDVNYKCKLSHDLEQRLNRSPRSAPAAIPYASMDHVPSPHHSPSMSGTGFPGMMQYGHMPPSPRQDAPYMIQPPLSSLVPSHLSIPPPPPPQNDYSMPYMGGSTSSGSYSGYSPSSYRPDLRPATNIPSPMNYSTNYNPNRRLDGPGVAETPNNRSRSHSYSTFRSLMGTESSSSRSSHLAPEFIPDAMRRLSLEGVNSSGSAQTSPRAASLASSLSFDDGGSVYSDFPQVRYGQVQSLGLPSSSASCATPLSPRAVSVYSYGSDESLRAVPGPPQYPPAATVHMSAALYSPTIASRNSIPALGEGSLAASGERRMETTAAVTDSSL